VQVNFNLGDLRALRNGLFDECRRLGVAVIVRTPLAAGFLTGTLDAGTAFHDDDHRSRYDADARARWVQAAERMQPAFDDAPRATPAQNALRFCLSFDAVRYVIPGMMQVAQVRENLAAAQLPRLAPARLRLVQSIYDDIFR
jgi:aryl-alcohol dehydrogenase-like predicted oxidoreductase